MRNILFLLSCLAYTGYARRVQRNQAVANQVRDELAELLAVLANEPQAAPEAGFLPSMGAGRLPRGNPARASSRLVVMQEKRSDTDGGFYTQKEFQDFYGDAWEEKWNAGQPDPSSVPAPPPAPVVDEKRSDTDGGFYTQKEFQDFYGDAWEDKWNAGQPETTPAPAPAPPPPPPPAPVVMEKRSDTDGGFYTQKEFQEFYGDAWEDKWNAGTPEAVEEAPAPPPPAPAPVEAVEEAPVEEASPAPVPAPVATSEEGEPLRKRDSDGGIYTKQEYIDYYGDEWQEVWDGAEDADHIKLLSELNVGDYIEEAEVLRYTDFGAFVDIGAEIDGLCHMAKIPAETWEYLDAGYTLNVTIEKIDLEKRQVGLTTGKLGERVRYDIKLLEELNVGDVIEEATVQRYTDFGAFMEIGAEVNALCHISKIPPETWENLDNGDTLKVTIERIDVEKGQVSVTNKEPGKPLADFQPGDEIEGVIVKVMSFGAFVEFGAECNGLIHVSEIANEFVSDINEKVQEGDKVKARIKEVDLDRKRVGLSMRDMMEGEYSEEY